MFYRSKDSVAAFFVCLLSALTSVAQPKPPAPDEVIMEKVREMDIKYTVSESGLIRFTFGVEQNRTQLVIVTGKVNNYLSSDYMTVLTRVARIDKGQFENKVAFDLLKKNWNYTAWFWQIREDETDGKVNVYLGSSVPVNTPAVKFYLILSTMAKEADTIEKLLTSTDEF
ncbi:hypothetical protein [Dyadobacter diqingensis]|uniref:hypothetical protein n=1 Tax=Dyadobacter diqingensis TaxID=2938121 RepID=UPI0020C1932C|nr:hypothetical protein [Dyadobacter diqingensis]